MEKWELISSPNSDWLTYLFGINFLLFVFCKQRFNQQFFSFLRVIDTPLYFASYGERFVLQQGFIVLTVIFSIVNVALFFGFLLAHYTATLFNFYTFLILFGGISLVVLIRQIILMILSYFFKIHHLVNQYQFRNATYLFRLSFLLYTGLIFFHFSFNYSPLFLEVLLYVVFLLYILYNVMIYRQFFKVIKEEGLYFILYLCSLKLSPWILLFKELNDLL